VGGWPGEALVYNTALGKLIRFNLNTGDIPEVFNTTVFYQDRDCEGEAYIEYRTMPPLPEGPVDYGPGDYYLILARSRYFVTASGLPGAATVESSYFMGSCFNSSIALSSAKSLIDITEEFPLQIPVQLPLVLITGE
jgi:hypothetical protein